MLEEFRSYLTQKAPIKDKYIPYYLKWVSDCYGFLNKPLSARLNGDQKKEFLSDMAKRHEDWQVKQADLSLRLYDYFLSRKMKTNAEGIPAAEGSLESTRGKNAREAQAMPDVS